MEALLPMSLPPADGGLVASREPPRRMPWFSSDQISQEYILYWTAKSGTRDEGRTLVGPSTDR